MLLCGAEPGEIVIRTPFRSLGYINAAEEHRARFIQNPFTDQANDLLYRTGDRGRYQPDGTLEILGRLDEQIKIRGVRIEPGEVMAVLNRHGSVNACVVVPVIVPINDEQGEPALTAYIVAKGGEDTSTSELQLYLSKHLPAVMVPSYFVFIDELPLTPNGKVDRPALPLPNFSCSEELRESVAPRNETERLLAGIWREVLGVNQVSVFDNFFALGGHSLKATQVMSRVSSVFQIDAPVRTLFEAPTVSDLAKAVEERLIAELEEMSEHEAHRLSR